MAKKILIIEDNQLSMKLFRDILVDAGYEVVTADNGDTGMGILNANGMDLLLVDIRLPGKSGIEIIDEIGRNSRLDGLKIVAITASAMKEEMDEVRKHNCDAYMVKPISLKPFIEEIREVMEKTLPARTKNGPGYAEEPKRG